MKNPTALRLLPFTMLIAPLQAIAQQAQEPTGPAPYYGGPMHMWGYAGGWPFWWMLPMMLLFIVVIGGVVLLFVRASFGHGGHLCAPQWHGPGNPSRSAVQILNERFARGEIQKEEYTERKSALLSGR